MDQEIMKAIVSGLRCKSCGKGFQVEEVAVLGHRDSLWYFGVNCSACRNHEVVAAVVEVPDEAGLCDDLNESERSRFVDPISFDDVLDAHLVLKDFDGDFRDLSPKAESQGALFTP
ncbi:MAG: hypothetical protein A2Y72_04205 [Chloroflexi bacterium RBG_13_53_26]|jgi:hypothetical protein|nr:MAG: hypothetical protein A2Y72_04205 [Chloroflexi bacterium RBG_13_53_26]